MLSRFFTYVGIVVLTLAFVPLAGADVLDSSLIVRFNFDAEPVGDVIVDTSLGGAHPGANILATWQDTEAGRAGVMSFDGTLPSQITLPAAADLNSSVGTITFWMESALVTPNPITVPGLVQFNTAYRDMTVNCYLAWDTKTREAVVFDTGADCGPVLQFAKANQLALKLILLTHTHPDHVADLARLKRETGAPAHVCQLEAIEGAEPFSEGQSFQVGGLRIGTRLTSGHSAGGITYVITGLSRPVAVVGDAIFAGSMGGGMVSYADAIKNNRHKILSLPDDTILCPGHGPLTSVGEEKLHNPFFPDWQKN